MDRFKLKRIAFEKMGKRKAHLTRETGFIFYHGLRTANLALNLRKLIFKEDDSLDDIIYAGALFHDIGKGIEPHQETGSMLIRSILQFTVDEDELEKIAEIIEFHNERDKSPQYPFWLKIVQDADLLDHMGTTEIWLNFFYSSYEDQSIDRSLEFYNSKFFQDHLVNFDNSLNYEISKKILAEKIDFVKSFILRLEKEAEGEIIYNN